MRKPASMLAEHYDLCVQAEKLKEEPIAKMLAVKELQDAGITLPQALCFQDNNLNQGNTELLMATVLLWTISETGTEEVFDGLAPYEVATMFGDGIMSGIVTLVAKG